MTTVSINQPCYHPWLGYFHRIALSDIHVILDNVSFEKNSFTNRNKIRTRPNPNNPMSWQWLTIPVKTAGRFGCPINELEIDRRQPWAKKHWKSIEMNYRKAPYYRVLDLFLYNLYDQADGLTFMQILDEMLTYMLMCFNINTPLVKSSQLNVTGTKSDLVLNLCKEVGADVYLSGPFGRDYLDEESFEKAGIEIRYHDFQHPTYKQMHDPFIPYMSAIDLIFNEGLGSRKILMGETECQL